MKLNLQTENIKVLEIEGETFEVDCNNLDSIHALDEFAKATQFVESVDESLIDKCHRTIDKVLGAGAYACLFKGMNKSIAPYYLCLDLVRIFQDEFMKDEREARQKQVDEYVGQAERMAQSMESLNRASSIAQSKYGGANASNFASRASNGSKRRR